MPLINLSRETLTTITDALKIADDEYNRQNHCFMQAAAHRTQPEHYRKADEEQAAMCRVKIVAVREALAIVEQLTDASDAVDAVLRTSDR